MAICEGGLTRRIFFVRPFDPRTRRTSSPFQALKKVSIGRIEEKLPETYTFLLST